MNRLFDAAAATPVPGRASAAAVLACLMASCSHSIAGPASPADAGGGDDSANVQTVLVGPSGEHAFLPATLTVPVGTTVLWFWESDGHNVTSGPAGVADGKFCSPSDTNCAAAPVENVGTMFRHTFGVPGTFPYFCAPHYSVGMKGTITVE